MIEDSVAFIKGFMINTSKARGKTIYNMYFTLVPHKISTLKHQNKIAIREDEYRID